MHDLCLHALDIARQQGATYADARIVRLREQQLSVEDDRVAEARDTDSLGIGIRVIAAGAWGFAATSHLDKAAIEKAAAQAAAVAQAGALAPTAGGLRWAGEPAHQGRFETPVQEDPFVVPVEEKIARLLEDKRELAARVVGSGEGWITEMGDAELRDLFALSRDAAVGSDEGDAELDETSAPALPTRPPGRRRARKAVAP